MYLYIYEGHVGGADRQRQTEELIRRSALLYMKEEDILLGERSGEILREPKGKPYFKEVPIEFSVSHSGKFWVCLFDTEPVGVDIQIIRRSSQEKIMKRYYRPEEKEFVETVGEEGFFQIWTRKEAYAKYLGTGLTEELKSISTVTNPDVSFIDFEVSAGIKGSCCMKEKKELWIKELV